MKVLVVDDTPKPMEITAMYDPYPPQVDLIPIKQSKFTFGKKSHKKNARKKK